MYWFFFNQLSKILSEYNAEKKMYLFQYAVRLEAQEYEEDRTTTDHHQLQKKLFQSSLVKLHTQVQVCGLYIDYQMHRLIYTQKKPPLNFVPSWQGIKQVLSEVFAVFVNSASELEEQNKQLLQKVKEAGSCLNDPNGKELQSKCACILYSILESTL